MNRLIFILVSITFFFSQPKNLLAERPIKAKCITKDQTEILIQSIILNEQVNKYLHDNLPSRTPLKIQCNEYIKKCYTIFYNKKELLITENENYEDLIKINLNQIVCKNGRIHLKFDFISKIEGVAILGSAEWIDEMWKIKILKEVLI